jgi:hypothetical protein
MMNSTYKVDLSSGALLTSSRSRLAGIQIGWESPKFSGGGSKVGNIVVADTTIHLLDGSASGDSLFSVCPTVGTSQSWNAMPQYYNLGRARILFPNGIYLKAVPGWSDNTNNAADSSKAMIVIFYE